MKLIRDWNEHAAPTAPATSDSEGPLAMRDVLRAVAVIVLIAAGIVALAVTGVLPTTSAPEAMMMVG